MRMFRTFLIAAVATVPLAALAAADVAANVDDGDKVVCKSRKQTGSRMAKRDCRSKAEWEQMAEESRRNTAETVNRPQISLEKGD